LQEDDLDETKEQRTDLEKKIKKYKVAKYVLLVGGVVSLVYAGKQYVSFLKELMKTETRRYDIEIDGDSEATVRKMDLNAPGSIPQGRVERLSKEEGRRKGIGTLGDIGNKKVRWNGFISFTGGSRTLGK